MYSWLGPFCPHVDRQWRLVYVENVDVAWYVSEYCKQVKGAGIKIAMLYGGVANFISQLGDISIKGGVDTYARD